MIAAAAAQAAQAPPYGETPVRRNPLYESALAIYEGALEDVHLDDADEGRDDAVEILESAVEVQRAVDDLDDAAQATFFCPCECKCESGQACGFAGAPASPPHLYAAICEPLLCADIKEGDDDDGDPSPKASAARKLFKAAADPSPREPRLSCLQRLQLFCCPPRNLHDDRDADTVSF